MGCVKKVAKPPRLISGACPKYSSSIGPRMKPSAAADEDGRRKVRPGWQGTPVGDDDLRAMREAAERCLHRQSAEPTGISLRQTKPYDGAAPVHDLRRPAG